MPPKHTPRHAKCHRVSLSADSNWLHDVISCPRRCPDNELAASADYERGGYINVHLFRPRDPRQMLVSAVSLTRALSLPPTLHPALLVLAHATALNLRHAAENQRGVTPAGHGTGVGRGGAATKQYRRLP